MDLKFTLELAKKYKSLSQIARILTENWVLNNSYCPNCGYEHLNSYSNNNPAADFFCTICKEDYELKSSKQITMQNKIVDGSYDTMIKKVIKKTNPNLLLLQYTNNYSVLNFLSIPRYFFVPEIIEKRKPLDMSAKRAGWVGCNILIGNLPTSTKIFLIKNEIVINPELVTEKWEKTSFLNQFKLKNRGWLLELISIIEKMPNPVFYLSELYKYEDYLKKKYPQNRFIREKIRQQLQVLREHGIVEFSGKGIYRRK